MLLVNGGKTVGKFYEKELQEFRKGVKLYVEWKGCNNLFNN